MKCIIVNQSIYNLNNQMVIPIYKFEVQITSRPIICEYVKVQLHLKSDSVCINKLIYKNSDIFTVYYVDNNMIEFYMNADFKFTKYSEGIIYAEYILS